MTKTTKHSPGPWSIPIPSMGFSEINDADGNLVFGLAAGSGKEKQHDDVCEANARLIAAAPELLKALVDCEDTLALFGNLDAEEVRESISNAKLIIYKARG